jgi:hypothetical protein
MRLTNTHREAFVRAVMNDVPQVDYDEQAQKLVNAWLDERCQNELGVSRKKLAESGWGENYYTYMPGTLSNFYTTAPGERTFPEKLKAALTELSAQKSKQEEQYTKLTERLSGIVNSCTTIKKLREALPEFAAYMPDDTPVATKNLPAIANMVSEFVQAGWPKGKPKEGERHGQDTGVPQVQES